MWRSSLAMRSLLHNSCSPGKWLIMHPGENFDRRLRDGKALANTKSASVGSLVGTKPPVASVRRIKEIDPLPTFRSSILWRNLRWLAGCSYWQSHTTRVDKWQTSEQKSAKAPPRNTRGACARSGIGSSSSRTSLMPSIVCKWVQLWLKGQPSGSEKRLQRGRSGLGGLKRCWESVARRKPSTACHWRWAPPGERLYPDWSGPTGADMSHLEPEMTTLKCWVSETIHRLRG